MLITSILLFKTLDIIYFYFNPPFNHLIRVVWSSTEWFSGHTLYIMAYTRDDQDNWPYNYYYDENAPISLVNSLLGRRNGLAQFRLMAIKWKPLFKSHTRKAHTPRFWPNLAGHWGGQVYWTEFRDGNRDLLRPKFDGFVNSVFNHAPWQGWFRSGRVDLVCKQFHFFAS